MNADDSHTDENDPNQQKPMPKFNMNKVGIPIALLFKDKTTGYPSTIFQTKLSKFRVDNRELQNMLFGHVHNTRELFNRPFFDFSNYYIGWMLN